VTRRVFVGAAFCLLLASPHLAARQSSAPGNLKNEDPDELYRRREDLASAARAAALWNDAVTTDFVAAWKLARAYYWLGTHAPEAERRAALERGVSAGENAVRLGPDRPEGHFWLAANMGTLAQSFGAAQGLKYRSRIKSELERAIAIDPLWEQASAETALGQWYMKVPRLFGGSRSKAEERFRRVLDRFPHSKNALLFLAEAMIADDRGAEARRLLERLVETPIEPQWAPEDRDLKRKAAMRLESLK
jgi:hypothetical protein